MNDLIKGIFPCYHLKEECLLEGTASMNQKTLRKTGYLPRLVDEQVERYLKVFGAVEMADTK